MSGLEIFWPDAAEERVRAARGRLEKAGTALRERSLRQRIGAVARVVGDWTAADSPWRRELAEAFAGTSGFATATVAEGLESALRAWSPEAFVAAAERELASVLDGGSAAAAPASGASGASDEASRARLALAPFEWTAVLAGGTIPMPTLLSSLLPLVVGSPVLLRDSSKDSVTGRLLARSLAARDSGLARAFEHVEFPWEEASALAALLEAPCVVATGADDTMRAIADRLSPRQRFVAYGHRVSLVVLGASAPFDRDAAARRIALDVARWDQTGCLSPVAVALVGFDEPARRAFAERCHAALEDCGRTLPRAEPTPALRALHATERAEARMRSASGGAWLLEGDASTVVLEADARPRSTPLFRFLRLVPVASLDTLDGALAALDAALSNVAVAGFPAAERARLVDLLAARGASRVCDPGRLQTPPIDWPRDGLPLFTPLARFLRVE